MANLVQIAINARNEARAALSQARQGVRDVGQAVQRSGFLNRQHTRTVRELVGVYRDANGQWYDARGNMVAQAWATRTVTTAYGRLANAIQNARQRLLAYMLVARMAAAQRVREHMMGVAGALALIAVKASVALAVLLPLGGALANLIPLVMLIAPAAAAGALAVAGLKLAFNGVSDALQAGLSGDTEEFEKALKKLEPAAANTVRELVRLRDAWKPLQQRVQGEVFAGAASELRALSGFIRPIADTWLPRLAKRFAETRSELADGLARYAADGRLEAVWRNIHAAVSSLLGAVKPLARAFGDVLQVASPRFAKLADDVRSLAERFADWIREARDSGKLGQWLDKAMETFGKLKDIVVNLGQTLGAIFGQAGDEGDDMLSSLVAYTQQIEDFFKSADGRELVDTFASITKAISDSRGMFEALTSVISFQQGAWEMLKTVAVAAWKAIMFYVGGAVMFIIDQMGMIVNGAAAAFGWVPGVGDKLKGAADAFNRFRDQVNAALNGIRKDVDVNVNYRARWIGSHLVSSAQQSGTYSSGIGGRAAGGPGGAPKAAGELGPEIVDFTRGMVYNANQTKRMVAAMANGGGGGGGGVSLTLAPGRAVGNPLADWVLSALKSGYVQMIDSTGRPVRFA